MPNDIEGLWFILMFFFISIILGYGLLSTFSLRKKYAIFYMFLSGCGHFLGAIAYCVISLNFQASDALDYFTAATVSAGYNSTFLGSNLIVQLVYWLRHWLFGSSYLGVFSFFAMTGFLGSVLYFIIFQELLKIVQKKYDISRQNSLIKLYSFFIICWPSSFYWASNVGKDSLCYFFMALFFLSLLRIKKNLMWVVWLCCSIVALYLIRPYYMFVVIFAFVFWVFLASNRKRLFLSKVFLLAIVVGGALWLAQDIAQYGGLASYSMEDVATKALEQQEAVSTGTHFSILTHNGFLMFLFLPITFVANLFLPLFIYAHNFQTVIASVQNSFLLIFVILFIKRWRYWVIFRCIHPILIYMFWFFTGGMVLLSMMSTNLGLSERQKLAYVPVFLIIMFLTFIFKRASYEKQEGRST